jgi:type IV secretory pathway TrbD component
VAAIFGLAAWLVAHGDHRAGAANEAASRSM